VSFQPSFLSKFFDALATLSSSHPFFACKKNKSLSEMFPSSTISFVVLSLLLATQSVVARERWLERDGRAVHLYPRRFGQENPAVIQKLAAACPGQFCGVLSGKAITPLLAAQPECSQQDLADEIIGTFDPSITLCTLLTLFYPLDVAQQFDEATKANMIAIAIEYRQAEKNTPPVSFG
jgi:hypothetical protein